LSFKTVFIRKRQVKKRICPDSKFILFKKMKEYSINIDYSIVAEYPFYQIEALRHHALTGMAI